VALPELILGDVVADGFGDDNPEFVEAVLNNKPNAFILNVLRRFNDPDDSSRASIAKKILRMDIAVEVSGNPKHG